MNMASNTMVIDVVDGNNVPVGTIARGQVLSAHRNFRTVHIIIKNNEDQFILQKLRSDHPRSPGLLGSSVAGYLKSGEDYKTAARRKLLNELRMRTPLVEIGQLSMRDEHSLKFITVFKGIISNTPNFDRNQIDSLIYIPGDDLRHKIKYRPEMFTATFISICNAINIFQ